MKVTLTRLGVVSLGRLFAIWAFVLSLLLTALISIGLLVSILLGISISKDTNSILGGGLAGLLVFAVIGFIGAIINAVIAFIFGTLGAVVYNIVLGVGGGIDLELKERDMQIRENKKRQVRAEPCPSCGKKEKKTKPGGYY